MPAGRADSAWRDWGSGSSPSRVAAGEKPGAGLPERERPGLEVPFSCCLGDHPGGRWDVAARDLPFPAPHRFGAGCQGFHRVTQILPIQGNSCPLTQLLADSIQVKWSTAEAHVRYLVPREAISGPLGRARVARHSIPWRPTGAKGLCQVFCAHPL